MLKKVWYNQKVFLLEEVLPVSEQKNVSKPLQLWNNAVKAVKGENTGALVEQFTAEMTLVAEGLCEDQARLRQAVEDLRREQDAAAQSLRSEQLAIDSTIRENQRDIDKRLDDISRRLSALEKGKARQGKHSHILNRATVLVSIVCGTWLLVTILNLFQ